MIRGVSQSNIGVREYTLSDPKRKTQQHSCFRVFCKARHYPISNLTLCVPCIVTNYVNGPTSCTFLFVYLFYNFHIHSPCFERSSRSSSGVRANLHDCTELCNTVHCDKLLDLSKHGEWI